MVDVKLIVSKPCPMISDAGDRMMNAERSYLCTIALSRGTSVGLDVYKRQYLCVFYQLSAIKYKFWHLLHDVDIFVRFSVNDDQLRLLTDSDCTLATVKAGDFRAVLCRLQQNIQRCKIVPDVYKRQPLPSPFRTESVPAMCSVRRTSRSKSADAS